jgi:hypothetical protein
MVTLPPLEVQKKVMDGTFNPSDYPHLKCGPAVTKKKHGVGKKATKGSTKVKDGETGKGKDEAGKKSTVRSAIRTTISPLLGCEIPSDHDIIRDRNPFLHRGMTYFECPEYTPNPDLSRPTLNSKNKSTNPETGK